MEKIEPDDDNVLVLPNIIDKPRETVMNNFE